MDRKMHPLQLDLLTWEPPEAKIIVFPGDRRLRVVWRRFVDLTADGLMRRKSDASKKRLWTETCRRVQAALQADGADIRAVDREMVAFYTAVDAALGLRLRAPRHGPSPTPPTHGAA